MKTLFSYDEEAPEEPVEVVELSLFEAEPEQEVVPEAEEDEEVIYITPPQVLARVLVLDD